MPSPSISNESVIKATGKDWKQWFALLDGPARKFWKKVLWQHFDK